jgi:cell division protein ZapA
MALVEIEVGGRAYELACRDGEEERLRLLGRLVDARSADVARAVGKASEARQLLLTALMLADDLDEARGHAGNARLEEGQRVAAIERYADRIERLAHILERDAVHQEGLEKQVPTP